MIVPMGILPLTKAWDPISGALLALIVRRPLLERCKGTPSGINEPSLSALAEPCYKIMINDISFASIIRALII
jgi:hypothetical protein